MDDNRVSNGIYLLTMRTPMHSYGAAKKINVRSNGRFKIPAGTLYGFLNKMLSKDLIYI